MIELNQEQRQKIELKHIVVSKENYVALQKLGCAGMSFNDVLTVLLNQKAELQS
jgi:predicted CopG family antitoxin